jgi:parallel beta-helix repeat protein
MSIAFFGIRSARRLALLVAVSVIASALLFTAPTPAGAGLPPVFVVDPAGNDNGPGTDAQPWRTLGTALDRIGPGNILLVRNGDYSGPLAIRKQASEAAPIYVGAYPGHRPVIHTSEWQGLLVENAAYVYVVGFEVVGNAQSGRGREAGLEIVNSHHVHFEGNIVHDFGGGGINVLGSNHVSIEHNEVYNTSWWGENQMSAISFWQMKNIGAGNNVDGYSNYINGNFVHGNENRVGALTDGNCIILDSNNDTGYAANTLISNNLCMSNGGRGIHIFRSSNAAVINNTLSGDLRNVSGDAGELSAIFAANVLFRNNLVKPGRPDSPNKVYEATGVRFDHNAYVASAADTIGVGDQLVPTLPMMFGVFPPIEGPTTDTANPDGAREVDFFGTPRTGVPDIGAFERR